MPIYINNAYLYTVTITNSASTQVFSSSATITAHHTGIFGRNTLWNAKVNETGSIVPIGSYNSLTIQNCFQSSTYTGVVMRFIGQK